MPEFDNDRLEQFFRKAVGKPGITFNEDDWKKLEARLDAGEGSVTQGKAAGNKVAAGVAVAVVVLFSGAIWFSTGLDKVAIQNETPGERYSPNESAREAAEVSPTVSPENAAGEKEEEKSNEDRQTDRTTDSNRQDESAGASRESLISRGAVRDQMPSGNTGESLTEGREHAALALTVLPSFPRGVSQYDEEKIFSELVTIKIISPAVAEKIKQKAVVELPGAEEETRGAEAAVSEEHASERRKHESLPRLSLLLSFAPDFSSTSPDKYTTPGKAFGAMVHYHIRNRWSISGGVIKNSKKYTGAGEDYHPPTGYWKYYTNGIIPYSIDGSCSVLEFPVMLQYTIAQNGRSRWLAGAGASSYLMLNESYRYNFAQPNPGAKDGWDSRNSSRFLFNMVNFTVAYERRVLPGLMIGIEPYIKIPLEEIGWTDLRLYSTGASITLRYAIMRRQTISTPARSRGPD